MYILKRTSSNNSDFQNLVLELDKDLANKNGETNDFLPNTIKQTKLKMLS